jgi:hypothetical protein
MICGMSAALWTHLLRRGGNDLLEEVEPLAGEVRAEKRITRDVAAGPGKVRHGPGADGITCGMA